MKNKLNLEKLILIFIVILPLLDMSSFLFRNYFNVNFSPSTLIRPLIPIIIITILFFKNKFKLKMIAVATIYGIYAALHLYIFNKLHTEISYGSISHELQYLINYTFSILNLFILLFIFYKKDNNKINNSILIANGIYILSIYISIITKTSSTTYVEGIGFKGWFESGNSISSILILNLFIIFTLFNKSQNIKIKIITLIEVILSGIFLITLLGTRTGLYGFVLVLAVFIFSKLFIVARNIITKNKDFKITIMHKIFLIVSSCLIISVIFIVILKGNSFLKRRKYLESLENNIYDASTGQSSHISGDILKIKENIEAKDITENYISTEAQQSILSLYKYCNEHEVSNTDRRTQQLIYNTYLVKNQSNIIYILFGNGFLTNFGELVLEMEIPAFLFNFGLIGFILYFTPFLALFIYYTYLGIKNIKKIDEEYIILLSGILMSFILSFLLGRIFFSSSAMIIIAAMITLLYNKCIKIKSNN